MLLSYKPVHLQSQQRLQEEGYAVDIKEEGHDYDGSGDPMLVQEGARGDGSGDRTESDQVNILVKPVLTS